MSQRIPILLFALVVIALLAWTGPVRADDNAREVQGTIAKVDPQTFRVTVRLDNGKEETFASDDNSFLQIRDNPFAGKLEDFRPGMKVTILVYPNDLSQQLRRITLMHPAER